MIMVVVVDKLSKYADFLTLSHPYSTLIVAQLFHNDIYKLHGLPSSIVSDKDKIFISRFRQKLFSLLEIQLKLSTSYHLQTDGQTEVVNMSLHTLVYGLRKT